MKNDNSRVHMTLYGRWNDAAGADADKFQWLEVKTN